MCSMKWPYIQTARRRHVLAPQPARVSTEDTTPGLPTPRTPPPALNSAGVELRPASAIERDVVGGNGDRVGQVKASVGSIELDPHTVRDSRDVRRSVATLAGDSS